MDREGRELLKDIGKNLDRQATAAEKLLELAEREEMVQVERGPSVCPNCGALNFTITQLDGDGSGPIDSFVMRGETHCCNRVVLAVPDGWVVVSNPDEAASILELKGGNNRG